LMTLPRGTDAAECLQSVHRRASLRHTSARPKPTNPLSRHALLAEGMPNTTRQALGVRPRGRCIGTWCLLSGSANRRPRLHSKGQVWVTLRPEGRALQTRCDRPMLPSQRARGGSVEKCSDASVKPVWPPQSAAVGPAPRAPVCRWLQDQRRPQRGLPLARMGRCWPICSTASRRLGPSCSATSAPSGRAVTARWWHCASEPAIGCWARERGQGSICVDPSRPEILKN